MEKTKLNVGNNGIITNSPQYRNDNIANFVSALPLEMNLTNEFCNLEMQSLKTNV